MTQNVLVLSVAQYRVTDEKTKDVNEGCTVRYLMTENMEQREDTAKAIKGHRPAKATVPFSDYHKFQAVPALYEASISYSVDSKGNAMVAPTEFRFLSPIVVNKATSGAKLNIRAGESQ